MTLSWRRWCVFECHVVRIVDGIWRNIYSRYNSSFELDFHLSPGQFHPFNTLRLNSPYVLYKSFDSHGARRLVRGDFGVDDGGEPADWIFAESLVVWLVWRTVRFVNWTCRGIYRWCISSGRGAYGGGAIFKQ